MEDLSREERLNQRIAKLEQQIYEQDTAFDKEQGKRVKTTFFVLSGVIYLLVLYFGLELNKVNIEYCLVWLVLSPIMAGVVIFISSMVLLHITNGAIYRTKTIAKLEGELSAVKSEKRNNLEDEKIKELKKHIEYLENYKEQLIEENVYLKLNKVFDNDAE